MADRNVMLTAANDVTVTTEQQTSESMFMEEKRKSGLFSSGGLSVTAGKQQTNFDQKRTEVINVGSAVASLNGNVTVNAGQQYVQTGSQLFAQSGDIDITAKQIDIAAASDTGNSEQETKFKQSGLTLALSSPVLSAIQTTQQMAEATSKTKDKRMQALAAGTSALAGKNAYDAVASNPGQAGGFNLSISIGASKSSSKAEQSSSTAIGSTVAAGGDIRMSATGAGQDSDLTIQGSNVKAGNNIILKADDEINLLAAKNTEEQHSTNKNSSGSIGFSIGSNTGFTVSASTGRGKADGNDVIWANTHVEAGNKLVLDSGGDTNLRGAVASGASVAANIGGDLNIESLQDTSVYKSKQSSMGGSLTIGVGVSGSVNASNSKTNSNFASVTEQSGIKAGGNGFQIVVDGNTDLKGGKITSSDKAVEDGKNSLTTGTLTTSDIENKAEYKGSSYGIGISYSTEPAKNKDGTVKKDENGDPVKTGYNGVNASMPAVASASGNAESVTQSGISAGTLVITDDAKQKELTGKDAEEVVASINRDTANTENSLKPIFNEKEVKAGFEIAAAFSKEVGTFLENRAKEADAKKEEAKKKEEQALKDPSLTDEQRYALAEDVAKLRGEAEAWGPDSTNRRILMAFTAATSGDVTGGTSRFAQSTVINFVQSMEAAEIKKLSESLGGEGSPGHVALHGMLACAGASAQGQICGQAGLSAASSSFINSLLGPADGLSAEQAQARSNLVQTLITGVAAAGGMSDVTAVKTAAQIETENNALGIQSKSVMSAMRQCSASKDPQCFSRLKEDTEKKTAAFDASLAKGCSGPNASYGSCNPLLVNAQEAIKDLALARFFAKTPEEKAYIDSKIIDQVNDIDAVLPAFENLGANATLLERFISDTAQMIDPMMLSGAMGAAANASNGIFSKVVNNGAKGNAANAATYPSLKKQLEAENLANIAAQDSRLAKAAKGSGTSNPNFSIGDGTAADADRLGKIWVGDGARRTSDGSGLISADGTRVYRPPTEKASPHATTGVQANFESYTVDPTTGQRTKKNGHLNITN